jgi:subfamily B ATP-binding cassette protein MsbA
MKLYFKILKFILPYWKSITAALVLTLFYVLLNNISLWVSVDFVREIFSPEYMKTDKDAGEDSSRQQHIDQLLKESNKLTFYQSLNYKVKSFLIRDSREDTLIAVCLIIFISFFFKNIFLYLKKVILSYTELQLIVGLRNALHAKIIALPLRYLEKRHSGDLTSVIFNDVNAIRNVMQTSLSNMFLSPVQIIANVVILILISWKLSLITFIAVPVSTFLIVKIGQVMRRRSRRVYKQIANVVATFQEAVTAIRIVKAFANEPKEIAKFESTNKDFFKKSFRANKVKFATSPLNEVILVLVLVALLWYGGNLVYSSAELTAEDFIRFLVFLFTMFQPIKDLSGINNTLQNGLAAAERIFHVLDLEEEAYSKPSAKALEDFNSKIEYKNVNFKYDSKERYVLKNINLDVRKSEMIAFVGQSGSGKTTLVNLLPRFYEIEEGEILIDGINTKDLTLHSLRNQMSIVTQDTILFNDSIRLNIAYGVEEVNEDEIISAAKAANAWEFIEQMPDGLDTQIGEKGVRLSGGQKQRLSIARAILKNPPILILDEATSALDTESERLVQDAIDRLLESRTVLVIAHRLSTIRNASKIVVLHRGKIEAMGPHDELLQTSAIYKNLYENQMLTGEAIPV